MQGRTPRQPPDLPIDAHKGVAGRVLLIAGSEWMPGAAILAARAAQRAGAGLVAVAVWDDALRHALPVSAPEAVMRDGSRLDLASDAWHAALVGPGIGLEEIHAHRVRDALLGLRAPLVVDADALTLLSQDPTLLRRRTLPTVLTPHTGEAQRLLGRAVPHDEPGRIAAAREIARKFRAICCLKGHGSIVTDGERWVVNPTGSNALATAGAGDVLAGITVAYLALTVTLPESGWSAFDAAERAVFVHGRAGDLAAEKHGPRSVIASDLIDTLSAAQKT